MVYSVVGIRIGPGMRHSWRTVRAGDGTIRRNSIKSLCTAAAQGVKPAQSRWMSMIGGRTGTDALHAVMLQVPMRRAGNNGGIARSVQRRAIRRGQTLGIRGGRFLAPDAIYS
ncbi:hypothetical protein FDU21_07000 [Xanthomonas oryzae pv. oryzae]|nr:hypothetical protein FDU21_07000 [Xanthomonas oryzae pv. oryzae]